MQNVTTPEIELSREGYQDLREFVFQFQTELSLATANTLPLILRRFQEKMRPYYWLATFDMVNLLAMVDQMFTCDITRNDLNEKCDMLIDVCNEEMEALSE